MPEPENQSQPNVDDPNGLLTIQADGVVPKSRIKNAATANALAADMWYADQAAAFDRAWVDQQVEGFAPLDQGDLRASGLGNSTNVNFLGSAGKEETALAAYNNLANSTEFLIQCEIEKGPREKRLEWARIFSEEYTKLLRFDWPNFIPNLQYLAKFFIRHGVAIAFKDSEWDWRWSVSRLGDFQVQRRQNCSADDVELAVQRSFENPDVVYGWIEDEKSAKEAGWNISATKLAIQNAVIPLYNSYGTNGIDPEMWERDAKDNSFFWTQGKAKQVELRHFWVKEFDGQVTHLICTPENDEDFLFKRTGRWDSMRDAFVLFCYGIGNGDLYSIRGLGWKLFGSEQLKNVLLCKMANSTMMSLGTVWQADTENGEQDFGDVTWGDFTVIRSGFKFQPIQWPNMTTSGIPLLNLISSSQSANTGTYTPTPNLLGNDTEQTATESKIKATQQATLSTSAADLFYQSLDRLDQMTVRSLIKEPYPEVMPGGVERAMFIKRLTDRGLTMEAIQSVRCVRHVRAIGAGSEAVAMSKTDSLLGMSQFLDPIGKREAIRLALIQRVGVDNVDTFLPPTEDRIPDDKKVAELESSLLLAGIVPDVMAGEIAMIHVGEHIQLADGIFGKLQQGGIVPPQAIEQLGATLQHIKAHLQIWGQSIGEESNSPDAQIFKQVNLKVNQMEGAFQKLVANTQRQMQAEQEAIAKQQQGMSAEVLEQKRKDMIAQAGIARADAVAKASIERGNTVTEQQLLDKRARTNADLEHQTAKTAAEIEHERALTNQELLSKTRKTHQELAATDLKTAQELEQSAIDNQPASV